MSFSYWISSPPLQTILSPTAGNLVWRTGSCQKITAPETVTWKSHREENEQKRELLERQFHRCPFSIYSNYHLVPRLFYPLKKTTPTDVVLKTRHFLMSNNLNFRGQGMKMSELSETTQYYTCVYMAYLFCLVSLTLPCQEGKQEQRRVGSLIFLLSQSPRKSLGERVFATLLFTAFREVSSMSPTASTGISIWDRPVLWLLLLCCFIGRSDITRGLLPWISAHWHFLEPCSTDTSPCPRLTMFPDVQELVSVSHSLKTWKRKIDSTFLIVIIIIARMVTQP